MAIPTLVDVSAKATGTGAVTPALPASMQANDIVILVASTIAGGSISITANGSITTWTALTGSPIDVTGGEKLYVWWGRWSSGSTGPTCTPGSDHCIAATAAFRGCPSGSSPIGVNTTGTEATSDTSLSFATGISSASDQNLVFLIATSGQDANLDQGVSSTAANTSLTSVLNIFGYNTNAGGGGGIYMATGQKLSAGSLGTWTATYNNASAKAYICFALLPASWDISAVGAIATAEAFGSPTVTGATITDAGGIASAEAVGSPTVTSPGVIADIDHSTGDFSQYTSVTDTESVLSVTAGAALAGTNYGLNINLGNVVSGALGEKTLVQSSLLSFRIYLDPNSVTMSASGYFSLAKTQQASGTWIDAAVVRILYDAGFKVVIYGMDDSNVTTTAITVAISDEPHYVEVHQHRATGSSSNDGYIEWWLDGTAQTSITGIDNYDVLGIAHRFCAGSWNVSGTLSGNFYADEFVVRNDDTMIGPVGGGASNITGVGNIASAEAFGSFTISGATITGAGGIASAEAVGTPSARPDITAVGNIASAEALGAPTLQDVVTFTGIASAEVVGTPSLQQTISPTGIASGEAVGSLTVRPTVSPVGIASSEAVGTPSLQPTVTFSGIASAEAFGNITLSLAAVSITNVGNIATAEAFGNITLQDIGLSITFVGNIATGEAFGNMTLSLAAVSISNVGNIATGEAVGSHSVGPNVAPSGIASSEAVGTPSLAPTVTFSGVASGEAFGNTTVTSGTTISNVGAIASSEALGTPTVNGATITGAGGIASGEAFGNMTLTQGYNISNVGNIATAEAIGTVSMRPDLSPTGIPSAEAFGGLNLQLQLAGVGNIASAQAVGSPSIAPVLTWAGIASAEAFGSMTFDYIPPTWGVINIVAYDTIVGSGLNESVTVLEVLSGNGDMPTSLNKETDL